MLNAANFLLPYEFAPTILILCLVAVALYVRGLIALKHAGTAPAWPRVCIYFLGVALMYGMLQTHYDYMSQHLLFLHRLQHLVLHHMAPFLILLAIPGPVLAAGVPARAREPLRAVGNSLPVRWFYRIIQQPVIATVLFVGLIYLWLYPPVHFYAMLNVPLYRTMNWSMAVDGLLFWYLILDWHTPEQGGLRYAWRLLILALIVLPQDAIGAYIAMSGHVIYNVYAICGRLWPISPMTDQTLAGLITWIPSAMMSVLGVIVVLHRILEEDGKNQTPAITPEEEHSNAYA